MPAPQLNIADLVRTAMAIRGARQQEKISDWQFNRSQEEYERQNKFRDALASGDAAAAQAADPMSWMRLQQQGLETKNKQSEIDLRTSQMDERKDKSVSDLEARTTDWQKRIGNIVELAPDQAGRWQAFVDEQAKAGRMKPFQVAGRNLLPEDQAGPQVLPNQREALAMQAAGGVDVAAKTRALSEQTMAMRKEFNSLKEVSDYKAIRQASDVIKNASVNGVGALSMIFAYMKALDPGSTVREGEQASARNAGGIPESLRAIYNRAIGKDGLTDNLRRDFITETGKLEQAARKRYDFAAENHRRVAAKQGVAPEDVVFPDNEPQAQGEPAAAAAPDGSTSGGVREVVYTPRPPDSPAQPRRREPPPKTSDPLDRLFDRLSGKAPR